MWLHRGRRFGIGAPGAVFLAVLAGCDGGDGDALPGSPAAPAALPAVPILAPHACGVRLTDLSINQGVKIPLVVDGALAPDRNAPIIIGRQALVRAFALLPEGTAAGHARARLVVESGGTKEVLADVNLTDPASAPAGRSRLLGGSSSDSGLESTFNFEVKGDLIAADTRFSVELDLGTSCAPAGDLRFPADGPVALGAKGFGALKVVLVPVRYDADGSGRLPDVSEGQIETYRRTLLAMFPIADLELSVRAEVGTDIRLGGDAGWGSLLDQLRDLRARDQAASDVYYYGLVSPETTFMKYCQRACTAGLSYLADRRSALMQTGVGVGFSGQTAADTLAHELGHQHGRKHAPCGQRAAGLDDGYPYEGGRTGAWGFDFRSNKLLNPASHRDLMSYCGPQWVSDYTYSALAERRASFGTTARVVASDEAGRGSRAAGLDFPGGQRGISPRYRVLLADGAGSASWGLPLGALEPAGVPEWATVFDAGGHAIDRVQVLRTALGHGDGSSLLVPEPQAGWEHLQVAGAAPISFRATSRLTALRELTGGRLRR